MVERTIVAKTSLVVSCKELLVALVLPNFDVVG